MAGMSKENLEDKHSSADCRRDDRPAGNKEVARVISNHVVHCQSKSSGWEKKLQMIQFSLMKGSPCPEAPWDGNALKEHEKEKTHTTGSVLIKQLEHVDSTLELEIIRRNKKRSQPTLEMQEKPTRYESKQTTAINISLWGLQQKRIRYTIVRLISRQHLPQVSWEFVHHGGYKALHSTKLWVEPKEHQHEEEETGPERGQRHLKDSTRIRQESKTRSWVEMSYIFMIFLIWNNTLNGFHLLVTRLWQSDSINNDTAT